MTKGLMHTHKKGKKTSNRGIEMCDAGRVKEMERERERKRERKRERGREEKKIH